MNAKNEKVEIDISNNPHLENDLNLNNIKDNFNIIIPKEESNIKLNKINETKNIKPSKKQKNIKKEINKEITPDLKNKILQSYKRLDIQNLFNSDDFSENFIYYPCKKEMMKKEQDPNHNLEIPYSSIFYDNILLRDESIFFIHDKTPQQKFFEEIDLKKIKTENVELNFGEDPFEKYYKILRGNIQDRNKIFFIEKLQENINNFHVFKCRIPNYISVDIENFKENELLNTRNNNFSYFENESMNSTKINSGTSNQKTNIQLNGNEFMLSNEFNDEENTKELIEKSGKKYINKKRKLKK